MANTTSQSGFVFLPIIIAVLLIGSAIGAGVYVSHQQNRQITDLKSAIEHLKVDPIGSPTPTATPTSTPIPKPVTAPIRKVVATPIPTPVSTPAVTPDKQALCVKEATIAKGKFITQVEAIKAKYQEEYNKTYYSLLAQKKYDAAKAFESGWSSTLSEANNMMAQAYDVALGDCLARK